MKTVTIDLTIGSRRKKLIDALKDAYMTWHGPNDPMSEPYKSVIESAKTDDTLELFGGFLEITIYTLKETLKAQKEIIGMKPDAELDAMLQEMLK